MSLAPGTRLGPYEITAQIGEGGMGEVYQATDTNLKRSVAIKVLPESVAGDPERLARFQREAEVLAALNHPNIAQIHGLEDSDGSKALVMELVEGPTLADRIAQGAIPVDEALPIAKQIAEALEAAHEQGIIHRDLKPANIKLRPDGTVKVLDFGLAKAMEPAVGSSPGMSQSPTITTPAMTQAGMILGTAAYMSPEQARGKPVDKRADIWAFGCVLYEMLTGTGAFGDEDVSMTLSKVLQREADFDALPDYVPARVRGALKLCLVKDPHQRVQAIGDVRLALEGAFETTVLQATETVQVAQPAWRRIMPWVAAAVGGLIVGVTMWAVTRPTALPPQRFSLSVEASAPPSVSDAFPGIAISPDGQRIVYQTQGETRQLVLLSLADGETTLLQTEGQPSMPFFSPDGAWVGSYDQANQALRRVSVDGGPMETITDQLGGVLRGASWALDDTIVYANANGGGLWRVSAVGGVPEPLTVPGEGETYHRWPSVLPDGQGVLFTVGTAESATDQVAVLSLETLDWDILPLEGTAPQYVPTGHLLYVADNTVRAVPFDMKRRVVTGASVLLEEGVLTNSLCLNPAIHAATGSSSKQ